MSMHQDDQRAARLRRGFARYVSEHPIDDIEKAVTAIYAALAQVSPQIWPTGQTVPLAFVFPEYFAQHYTSTHHEPCGPEHPLVRAGLADVGEYYGGRFSDDNPPIFVLLNLDVEHVSLRWLDPAGDRTIVVLPTQYEGAGELEN